MNYHLKKYYLATVIYLFLFIPLPAMDLSTISEQLKKWPQQSEIYFTAIQDGDLNTVKKMLDDGIHPNQSPYYSTHDETALHVAAEHGHVPVIQELLSRGAGVNARADNGETPLYTAVLFGKLGVVRILLKAGADPNYQVTGWRRDRFYALLLKYSNSNITRFNTPLKVAEHSKFKSSSEIANVLLIYGAEIEERHFAVNSQLRYPMYIGSHLKNRPWQPFPISILEGQPPHESLEYITIKTKHAELNQGIAFAAAKGKAQFLNELLHRFTHGVDYGKVISIWHKIVSRVFHIAAFRGHESTVKELLPFTQEKELGATWTALKNLLNHATLSEEQKNSYKKILFAIVATTLARDLKTSYFGKLPKEIRDMIMQLYVDAE